MTDVLPTGTPAPAPTAAATAPAPETGAPPGRTRRAAAWLAAVSVPLGAALMLASAFLDPTAEGVPEPLGTFVAYGRDRAGADLAATLLHYGMVLFGVGLLVAAFALVSRRGRATAVTGGVLSAIGFVNLSGMVFSDWYDAYLASALGPERAMDISNAATDMPALTAAWVFPAFACCVLGPIVVLVGLARARVASWWLLACPVVIGGLTAVGDQLGNVGFVATLGVSIVFGVLLGVGLVRRAETETV